MAGLVFGNRFKVEAQLGKGSFGEIYQGRDSFNRQEIAIKLEPLECKYPQLSYEYRCYGLLHHVPGLPKVYWYGKEHGYRAMVMELMGPSLDQLFTARGRKFSLQTVCALAEQLITRIEGVHGQGLVYRDIKPDNFVIGRGKMVRQVYIIDFGLSKPYIDFKTKLHIPYSDNHKLTGTARYASINAHFGVHQSRRDDIEALGHMLIYFMRGSLPWQGLQPLTKNREDHYRHIGQVKRDTPIEQLCAGLPPEVAEYLRYARSLEFDQRPNYEYLRELFRSIFKRLNRPFEGFDWEESVSAGTDASSDPALLPPVHQPVPPGYTQMLQQAQQQQQAQAQQAQASASVQPARGSTTALTTAGDADSILDKYSEARKQQQQHQQAQLKRADAKNASTATIVGSAAAASTSGLAVLLPSPTHTPAPAPTGSVPANMPLMAVGSPSLSGFSMLTLASPMTAAAPSNAPPPSAPSSGAALSKSLALSRPGTSASPSARHPQHQHLYVHPQHHQQQLDLSLTTAANAGSLAGTQPHYVRSYSPSPYQQPHPQPSQHFTISQTIRHHQQQAALAHAQAQAHAQMQMQAAAAAQHQHQAVLLPVPMTGASTTSSSFFNSPGVSPNGSAPGSSGGSNSQGSPSVAAGAAIAYSVGHGQSPRGYHVVTTRR